jgi:hypothetical protein
MVGYGDAAAGKDPVFVPLPEGAEDPKGPWDAEVTVKRLGEVQLPVTLLVAFADGTLRRESWDGRDRWKLFRYPRGAKVVRAVVDPEKRIALDVNPGNNGWREEKGLARRAASKLGARFLFWLQNLLELHAVLG